MKKILTLALMLAIISTTAFCNPAGRISKSALIAFNKTYSDAKEVRWETVGEYMKVTFITDGQQLFAYYNNIGDQVALSRNIAISQLPICLVNELKSKCTDRWITELFELNSNGETFYFATLYSADQILVLKADPSGNWSTFKKRKRAEE